MREEALYWPVKAFLAGQGYAVKGEVSDCDIVALRGDEPPVIVELKRAFSLALVYQGITRQSISDDVYLAVPPFAGRLGRARRRDATGLCRRLGLGLMIVETGMRERIVVLLDPAPYRPRKHAARKRRLLREFANRVGDPNAGGSAKRPMVTAYRQDALRVAALLARDGPTKASVVAATTGVARAARMLQRDVYGWFERAERGIYRITPQGLAGLETWADVVTALEGADAHHAAAPLSQRGIIG